MCLVTLGVLTLTSIKQLFPWYDLTTTQEGQSNGKVEMVATFVLFSVGGLLLLLAVLGTLAALLVCDFFEKTGR